MLFDHVGVYYCAFFQYQGSVQALGQGSSNRRQLVEIEGAYVQQLQTENSELKVLLEEHQSALEMIMSKYRSQVFCIIILCYAVQLILASVK